MQQVIGIVANPKLKRPLLASWDNDYVKIFRMEEGWPHEGSGYYDSCNPGSSEHYWVACEVTGYPRVHVPSGVQTRGGGYGTSLYTALCLGAHQSHERRLEIPPRENDVDGDGVSSQEGTRSGSAEQWWSRAKRLGLAREIEGETSGHGSQSGVDVTSDLGDRLVGETIDEGTVTYVNDVNVDLETEGGSATADAYPWQNAEKADLVIADFLLPGSGSDKPVWQQVLDGEAEIEEVNIPALIALNVRGLSLEAINLLGVLAKQAGAAEHDLELLRLRWEHDIDILPIAGHPIPMSLVSPEDRPFAFNSPLAREALERAEELRAETDWERLEELP